MVKNLKVMARMGVYFEEEVQRRYPEFPTRKGEWGWEDYLPPMSKSLSRLSEAFGLCTNHVGADVLVCAGERSSPRSGGRCLIHGASKNCGAFAPLGR